MATYGLAATNNVFKSLDSTSCTIFKVVTETVNGQTKTTLPKWGGIDGIKNKLLRFIFYYIKMLKLLQFKF